MTSISHSCNAKMNVLLVSILLVCIGVCSGQNGTDAKNLRTQLFVTNAYDKKVLPMNDQSYTVDVYVSFHLLTINGLDEVTETLKTTGYLLITWYDDFLVWDPADYGGIEYYHWPQNDVWKPDVTLKNSVLQYKELGASGLNVEVYYDGQVFWYPFQVRAILNGLSECLEWMKGALNERFRIVLVEVFESTCSVDITYFPFDVQECDLTFVAWSYTIYDVYMYGGSSGIDLEEFEENSLWKVTDSSWTSELTTGESAIKFTLKMRRKPLYFLLSVIMPIVMLAVLNVFVFTLPCESGERAGYAITVFLALAVFLTIISTQLPANSESVAIFSIYVIIQTLQSTVTAVLSLITIRLSTRETEVPSYLKKLVRLQQFVLCRRRKRKQTVQPCDTNGNLRFKASVLSDVETFQMEDREMTKMERKNDAFEREDTTDGEDVITWPLAVRAIDLFLFILFFLILAASTTVCFSITAVSI